MILFITVRKVSWRKMDVISVSAQAEAGAVQARNEAQPGATIYHQQQRIDPKAKLVVAR